jgi:hypothetical protein
LSFQQCSFGVSPIAVVDYYICVRETLCTPAVVAAAAGATHGQDSSMAFRLIITRPVHAYILR